MNGIESLGSAGFADHTPHKVGISGKTAAAQGNNGIKRSAGLSGALQMSGEFLRQTMAEQGFIDMQASNLDRFKAFIKLASQPQEQAVKVSFDPVTASEIAARMGAQTAGDINQALRILAQVDPGRVAALLK